MNKNLTLIYPPKLDGTYTAASDVSLALLYLAGAARKVCNHINIFDFNAPLGRGKTIDELICSLNSADDSSPIIGINCLYSAIFPKVREIAQVVKREIPSSKIIIGGMHPTLFADEIIHNCPEFDAVIIGEGDDSFPQLLRYWFGEVGLDELSGVCLRVDGKVIINPKKEYIRDLDGLSQPGYEFFDFSEYEIDTSGWYAPDGFPISRIQMSILTSRSCPNQCNFCSMYRVMGKRFRARSAESVFEEIKFLYDKYDINYFKIMDDNFTFHRERAEKICRMIIDSGMKAYFDTPNGLSPKALDLELLKLMRQAGFILIAVAVESGSDYIRNEVMGKRVSKEHIVNVFEWCHEVGIMAKSFFIIGMPEDTVETLAETADLMRKIKSIHIQSSIATPLPGTKLYEQCERDNLFAKPEFRFSWEGDLSIKKVGAYYGNESAVQKRKFKITPYVLSIDRLAEIDMQLQCIASEKNGKWIERLRRNEKLFYESLQKSPRAETVNYHSTYLVD